MTSLTLCLYVTAGVVIGMLTAFAMHNRRVGWKKSRITFAEAMDDLYADLGLGTDSAAGSMDVAHKHFVVARREEVPVDPSDFSDQLLRLKVALGDSAAVTPREAIPSEDGLREMVPAQTR